MNLLNNTDIALIVVYISVLLSLGIFLKKKSSRSLKDYFLGGNKLPWWAMGISGMSSYLDMAGTMLIVSFLYMLGPRGLYIEFRGGAVLILAFMLLWSGKWNYRSRCMTGAEWMIYRFGESWGGQFARIISSVAIIVTTIGMLAYLIKALGIFMAIFLPFSPAVCALIMISIATLYTVLSGFYGVVYTDLFQSVIVISAIIFISVLAISKIADINDIGLLASNVTGNKEWISSSMKWTVEMPKGYEAYEDLTILAFFYFIRNMLIGISSAGADPRYFGARSERECGTLSFLWTSLMMLRWPMMMGFALLGIILVRDFFPDQSVVLQTSEYIKSFVGEISKQRWNDLISGIINSPGEYNSSMIEGIKNTLGENWQSKLELISYHGTINTENLVPSVILYNFPSGVRGFFLVTFVAAALSTFNSSVNKTTAYFTRDIYQRYIRNKAANRELIFASYIFIVVLVSTGYILAYNIQSINQIWGWIIMSLGGGLAIPSALKFYWWRFNGGGYAIGTTIGIIAAFVQMSFFPEFPEWQQFMIIAVISLTATIIGTYLTEPTENSILENFYKTTKPFGFWKPFKNILEPVERLKMVKEHRNDLSAVPFTLCWQVSLFLLPMQFMIKSYDDLLITLCVFVIGLAGMYWFWYRNLPAKT